MWQDNFGQLKDELVDLIDHELTTAIDVSGQSVEPYKVALGFLSSTIKQVSPALAVELRHPSAEKSLIFVCTPWTAADRSWIDAFAVFDHRTQDDMKIVWLPGKKESAKLREMYQSMQSMGCSDALKEVMRKHGALDTNKNFPGEYAWFWNVEAPKD